MPGRLARWAARWSERHRIMTIVIVSVLVSAPGYGGMLALLDNVSDNGQTTEQAAVVAAQAAEQAKDTAEEAATTAEVAKAAAEQAQVAIQSAQTARDEARKVSCDEANVIAGKHNQLVTGFQNLLRAISAPTGQRTPESQAAIDEFARQQIAKFEPIKIPMRDCSAEGIANHFEEPAP